MPLRPVDNPPNPWASTHMEWLEPPPPQRTVVLEERARSALSCNDSPDLPFRFSLNPYRGCLHACAYCYARPSHQYLDLGAGTDFDRKIVVKTNIAQRLRETFEKRSWEGDLIVFSGNTDCYQPLEASYRLTRECLDVCATWCNPVGLITKAALIRRDIDILQRLARDARVHVNVSIAFADPHIARAMDPGAPSPSVRFDTVRALADAGISVGVSVSPLIPGLNDEAIVEILERAAECGATSAFQTLVRLAPPVDAIFEERLREALPLRADKVMNAIREMRGGELSGPFHARMTGTGKRWEITRQLFDSTCRRLGFGARTTAPEYWSTHDAPTTFRRPGGQLSLF